jgi:peptide/nickel transport system ATP-binding protein
VVADRIAVMYLGRLVEIGEADGIVANPRHPYTKALVSAVPDLDARPELSTGDPASPLDLPPGCAFHPRCPVAEPVCKDTDFDPHLVRVHIKESPRMLACVHTEVS